MSLPHELLDEICGYLPPDDKQSLRACSLVARSWVSPARRRLFSSVTIAEDNYLLWRDKISPTNTELLNHVRSLQYFTASRAGAWAFFTMNDFSVYLPSFQHLQHLTLCSMRIKDISQQLEAFSSFRHTLSSLTLHALTLTWFAFIAIVDYFPNVRDLTVSHPLWEIYQRHPVPLSRALRGKLSIDIRKCRGLPIFSTRLSGLKVECDELFILGGLDSGPPTSHYQRVVDACAKSLKRLRLGPCAFGSPLTLERCPKLCLLEVLTTIPGEAEHTVISSITSTNLRTIVFLPDTYGFSSHTLADRPHYWDPLDNTMCGLANKLRTLGYKHTLELEFQFASMGFDPKLGFGGFLRKFRGMGRVKILNTSSGEILGLAVRVFRGA